MGEPDLAAIEVVLARAQADKEKRAGQRTAAEVIAHDETLRPFSIRLTAKEIVALKNFARLKGLSTSDFVRSLLKQGLALEAAGTSASVTIAPETAVTAVSKILDLLTNELGFAVEPSKSLEVSTPVQVQGVTRVVSLSAAGAMAALAKAKKPQARLNT